MMTRWKKENQQLKLEMVMLDQLVKPDHLLRKIESVSDKAFNNVFFLWK